MTLRSLLLPAALVVGLSACSSSRSGYPSGRTIPTPDGNVIVMDDGRVYRDRDRNGVPDVYEDRDRRSERNARATICHRGRTQTVSSSAVRAHVNHGDYVGQCRTGPYDRNGNGRIDRDEQREYERRQNARTDRDDDRRERDGDRRERNARGRGHDRGKGHH